MHDYKSLKRLHGSRVSQTIDSPIMIFDFWELSEAFTALFVVLLFGVVFYSWGTMFLIPYARTFCDAGDSVEEQSRDFLSLAIPALGLSCPVLLTRNVAASSQTESGKEENDGIFL